MEIKSEKLEILIPELHRKREIPSVSRGVKVFYSWSKNRGTDTNVTQTGISSVTAIHGNKRAQRCIHPSSSRSVIWFCMPSTVYRPGPDGLVSKKPPKPIGDLTRRSRPFSSLWDVKVCKTDFEFAYEFPLKCYAVVKKVTPDRHCVSRTYRAESAVYRDRTLRNATPAFGQRQRSSLICFWQHAFTPLKSPRGPSLSSLFTPHRRDRVYRPSLLRTGRTEYIGLLYSAPEGPSLSSLFTPHRRDRVYRPSLLRTGRTEYIGLLYSAPEGPSLSSLFTPHRRDRTIVPLYSAPEGPSLSSLFTPHRRDESIASLLPRTEYIVPLTPPPPHRRDRVYRPSTPHRGPSISYLFTPHRRDRVYRPSLLRTGGTELSYLFTPHRRDRVYRPSLLRTGGTEYIVSLYSAPEGPSISYLFTPHRRDLVYRPSLLRTGGTDLSSLFTPQRRDRVCRPSLPRTGGTESVVPLYSAPGGLNLSSLFTPHRRDRVCRPSLPRTGGTESVGPLYSAPEGPSLSSLFTPHRGD
ncbi:hypothetical protein J6590_016574 [Homalodisca vitripennis]|nr:hypothetical protein J6590_016574 [Homalodisca vitripennis]